MTRASLIATLSATPSSDGRELTALPASIEWLEVRADLVGDLNAEWLRNHFRGRLLYSLRSCDSSVDRQQRLKAAAASYDRVELDAEQDLSETLLSEISVEKRLVSWYGNVSELSDLQSRFRKMSA